MAVLVFSLFPNLFNCLVSTRSQTAELGAENGRFCRFGDIFQRKNPRSQRVGVNTSAIAQCKSILLGESSPRCRNKCLWLRSFVFVVFSFMVTVLPFSFPDSSSVATGSRLTGAEAELELHSRRLPFKPVLDDDLVASLASHLSVANTTLLTSLAIRA